MVHQPSGQGKDEEGEGKGTLHQGAHMFCAPIAGAGQSPGSKPDLGTRN